MVAEEKAPLEADGDRRLRGWRCGRHGRLEHTNAPLPPRSLQPQAAASPGGAGIPGRSARGGHGETAVRVRPLGNTTHAEAPRRAVAPKNPAWSGIGWRKKEEG